MNPTISSAKEVLERSILHNLTSGSMTFGLYDTYSHLSAVTLPPIITRDIAGALCRDLRDRGMVEFRRGLWTEDGEPFGAGYGITPRGLRYRCALDEIYGVPHGQA